MKILTVSDVVIPELYREFDINRFHDIDLVLGCGDLPPEYLAFLLHAMNAPLYYVKGNHDLRYDSSPPMGCLDIHGRIVKFKGLNIMGLGGSRWYNGGINQYTEAEMRKTIRRMIPSLWWHRCIDILITHAPPRHVHDAEDRCHRGFDSFCRFISRKKPRYLIHGHIHRTFDHPRERITLVEKTEVINTYGYHILEINDDKIS
ncbi:MAG: metallophosphoesterase [Desulfamplus sp.]|nr:metallophosphoesterase [Desulfamplus sp.]